MTLQDVVRVSVGPALYLLPAKMTSPGAEAMMLAIGLQESRFTHREQIHGPARGFWQFEPVGIRGVWNHGTVGKYAKEAVTRLYLPQDIDVLSQLIAVNDTLAAVFARCLLFTVPASVPGRDDPQTGWEQYLWAWRPGRPHRETWDEFYKQAWEAIV